MSDILHIEPLSRSSFASYGDVIGGHMPADGTLINQGTTTKFATEALNLATDDGQGQAFLYRAKGQSLPLTLRELERHRLGSQTFVPMGGVSFVVVVALSDTANDGPDLQTLRAFWIDGNHAITLRAGTWHHGLIAAADGDFVVIERVAAG
ncbi:MAG: ureidoglycolate lyase, partial [Burkholderiaceae bacterium]|nr:ureidoglycolate lyase [Burkholderiaceae bacterium]